MSYLLLTGVTGLVGRYLVRDLLQADVPLALLVRPSRRASGRQRVETVMDYWEQQLGRPLPRPVVLEGDIAETDLGIDARSLRWVAENCSAVLHNAASLTFHSTSQEGEPWRSNVEGTQHVLDVCQQAGIRKFHHVSTAYVCGLREGRIYESELDVGQQMSNDYERSKVQAEKLVRNSPCLDEVTVYRPAIIIGDSETGYTTTYHGFYAPLQLAHTLAGQVEPNETSYICAPARFPLVGFETKNLVPVDWVSAVIAHVITHPEHHGKTYHLTPRQKITIRLLGDVLQESAGFYSVRFEGTEGSDAPLTEQERVFREIVGIYASYWRDDPTFDATNTITAAPHLPCPHIDRQRLLMMARAAQALNFSGPKTKPVHLSFDVPRLIDAVVETLENQSENTSRSTAPVMVSMQVTGSGGGDWHFELHGQRVTSIEPGLKFPSVATLRLTSDTLAALLRAELGIDAVLADGRLQVVQGAAESVALSEVVQSILESLMSHEMISR